MPNYIYEVLAHKSPIRKIISASIMGTELDTLSFSDKMTRLYIKNTGTASLTFSVGGNADLTDTLAAGDTFDDEFFEFTELVMSGTTGSAYKVAVG
jgi:hypothetical protein